MRGDSKAGLFPLKGKPQSARFSRLPLLDRQQQTAKNKALTQLPSHHPTSPPFTPAPQSPPPTPHPERQPHRGGHREPIRNTCSAPSKVLQLPSTKSHRVPGQDDRHRLQHQSGAPGTQQQLHLAPQHRGRAGARPQALPAPRAAVPAVTHGSLRPAAGDPRPPARPAETRAAASGASPHPARVRAATAAPGPPSQPRAGPASRRREGVPRGAPRPPALEHHPSPPRGCGTAPRLSAHSRAAAAATTAPTPPPLAPRAGHGAAASRERRRQSPDGRSTWRRRKWRRGPRPTPKQPQPTCSSPPWNPFSRKAGFSPHRPPPAHSTMSWSSPPRPGSWRSLPPRWAVAEKSCPRRSGCGKRVLAAPCVRREWSCCKMAAEAHAAGSKPDPVPLASERGPGARARAPA